MAESRERALLSPFRDTAARVRFAGTLRHRLGEDWMFWARLQALDALPACVLFDPFASPRQWPTGLTDATPARLAASPAPEDWTGRLIEHARRRPRLAVAPTLAPVSAPPLAMPGVALMPTAGQPPTSEPTRAMRANETSPRPNPPAPAGVPAPREPEADRAGVRAALRQVAALVEDLETSEPAPVIQDATVGAPAAAASGGAANPKAPRHAATADAATNRAARAPLTPASIGQRPAAAPAAGPAPLTSLAALVADLWPGVLRNPAAGTPEPSPAQSESSTSTTAPTPRAASRLLGDQRVSLAAIAPAGSPLSPPAPAPLAPLAGARPGTAWPQAPAATDEDLAERLNRQLLEQAWLRGVDLT